MNHSPKLVRWILRQQALIWPDKHLLRGNQARSSRKRETDWTRMESDGEPFDGGLLVCETRDRVNHKTLKPRSSKPCWCFCKNEFPGHVKALDSGAQAHILLNTALTGAETAPRFQRPTVAIRGSSLNLRVLGSCKISDLLAALLRLGLATDQIYMASSALVNQG